MNRTSKHKKKIGLPSQDQRCAVAFGPRTKMFDAPVGGVNADHGGALEEDRKEEDEEWRGQGDGSICMVDIGPKMALDAVAVRRAGSKTSESLGGKVG